MPWVVFDPVENDYLCEEQGAAGGALWDRDIGKATRYETSEKARKVFENIDSLQVLPHIHPLYVEERAPRKRWEDMTFEEKMATIEDDFHATVAERVERKLLNVDPFDVRAKYERLTKAGYVVTNQVHDEYLVERRDKTALTEEDERTIKSIMGSFSSPPMPMHNIKPVRL